VVAVSVAIAMMLQCQSKHLERNGRYNVKSIITDSYELASECLETEEQVVIIHLLFFHIILIICISIHKYLTVLIINT